MLKKSREIEAEAKKIGDAAEKLDNDHREILKEVYAEIEATERLFNESLALGQTLGELLADADAALHVAKKVIVILSVNQSFIKNYSINQSINQSIKRSCNKIIDQPFLSSSHVAPKRRKKTPTGFCARRRRRWRR